MARLKKEDHDPNIKEIIRNIQKYFPNTSIKDPYDYVNQIQADEILKTKVKKLDNYILKKLGLNE